MWDEGLAGTGAALQRAELFLLALGQSSEKKHVLERRWAYKRGAACNNTQGCSAGACSTRLPLDGTASPVRLVLPAALHLPACLPCSSCY